uniref:Uncharacterized protein n=1 Tax=Acrobeloides nanus TaxID=290746 RepID=A0A914CT94_9BILA
MGFDVLIQYSILTDDWRKEIDINLKNQISKLQKANIFYKTDAPLECYDNSIHRVEIYVALAKNITLTNNGSSPNEDVLKFGKGLICKFGLCKQACKNFILLVGVEELKLAYAQTGVHLVLTPKIMDIVFNQLSNIFEAENPAETLNQAISDIGKNWIDG